MFDDGSHGDQVAGDRVWSRIVSVVPGRRFHYVYTNSGASGVWGGVALPEIRSFVLPKDGETAHYRPIETFGVIYMQADGWHTDRTGYGLIARELAELLDSDIRTVLDSSDTDGVSVGD